MELVAIITVLAAVVAIVIGIAAGHVPPLWPW